MDLSSRIIENFSRSTSFVHSLSDQMTPLILRASTMIFNSCINGGKVLLCGNGISSPYAQYFSRLLNHKLEIDRPGLAAINLNSDIAVMMSIADDRGYEYIFSQQIQTLAQPNDVLIIITNNDASLSIVHAIESSRDRGTNIIMLAGNGIGESISVINDNDIIFDVVSNEVMRVNEAHLLIIHCLADAIDQLLIG